MCEKASRAAAVAGTITAISFTGRQTISPRLHELCVAYQLCFVLIDADLMFSEGSLVLGLLLLNRSNFLAVEPQVSTHTTGQGTDCCWPTRFAQSLVWSMRIVNITIKLPFKKILSHSRIATLNK